MTQQTETHNQAEVEVKKLRETLEIILAGAEGHVPLNNDWVCRLINNALGKKEAQ